eukprot:192337_1
MNNTSNSPANNEESDPFAIMQQYMEALQERAKKDPIINGPEYILSGQWGMVQNGKRYTQSQMSATDLKSILVVPANAQIIEKETVTHNIAEIKQIISGFASKHPIRFINNINDLIFKYYNDNIIEIYVQKSLGFHGHPPASIDMRVCHKNMGIASHEENSKLFIGSFGEWRNMEGAARVNLIFLIPKHIKYETSNRLAGDYNIVNGEGEMFGGWWYGATNCGTEWNKIEEQADHKHSYKVHDQK